MRRTLSSDDDLSFAFVVRFRDGVDAASAAARIDRLPGVEGFGAQNGVQLSSEPLEVRRLDQIGWMPLALAGFLALLGLVAVGHLLVTSTRRRSRDFAILKVLGCNRRQLRVMVAWQATLVIGASFAVAALLGIAAGAALWYAATRSIGLDDTFQVPWIALVAIAIAAVALANAVAVFTARRSAGTPAAGTLRTE